MHQREPLPAPSDLSAANPRPPGSSAVLPRQSASSDLSQSVLIVRSLFRVLSSQAPTQPLLHFLSIPASAFFPSSRLCHVCDNGCAHSNAQLLLQALRQGFTKTAPDLHEARAFEFFSLATLCARFQLRPAHRLSSLSRLRLRLTIATRLLSTA
ncbi:hypothetical protein C8Q79DRAFT_609064 [Trametes meyenii]|nr:hypothetical protein C8Q79DRAFT_609064 [Trametes meyenii]